LTFDTTQTGDSWIGILSKRQIPEAAEKSRQGKLLFYSPDLPSWIGSDPFLGTWNRWMEFLYEQEEKVVILCDPQSLATLFKAWCVTLFGGRSNYPLYRSSVLRFQYFYQHFLSQRPPEDGMLQPLTSQQFDAIALPFKIQPWPKAKAAHLSVEFLLANYLIDGSYKIELKQAILPLLKKDLEKYLYELKEILYVHLLHETFIEQFKLSKKYSLEDFDHLLSNELHPSIKVFLDPKIWITQGMAPQSSGKHIRLEVISQEHIEAFRQFNEFAGGRWEEEKIYQFVKSDIHKLEFLKILHAFSDDDLEQLLSVEAGFQNASGTFFSIDLVTVNHYLIHHTLNLRNHHRTRELEWLRLELEDSSPA
jgi:hypothetical protein